MNSKIMFILLVGVSAVVGQFIKREKRNVLELKDMVKCMLNDPACDPEIYSGYGCFCGVGGEGTPVDEIDRCCKQHDECYGKSVCSNLVDEYVSGYYYKCVEHPRRTIKCGSSEDKCSSQMCECDRQIALCLAKFPCPTKTQRKKCSSPGLHANSIVQSILDYLGLR